MQWYPVSGLEMLCQTALEVKNIFFLGDFLIETNLALTGQNWRDAVAKSLDYTGYATFSFLIDNQAMMQLVDCTIYDCLFELDLMLLMPQISRLIDPLLGIYSFYAVPPSLGRVVSNLLLPPA